MFKIPMAALRIEQAVKNGENTGNRVNTYSGVPNEDRIFMAARCGDSTYLMARVRICQATDFCGGIQISSMEYKVTRRNEWSGSFARAEPTNEPLSYGGEVFMTLPDITEYIDGDNRSDEVLTEYLFWSMAQAVLSYARYYERSLTTCLDRAMDDSRDNTYETLVMEGYTTAALMAVMAGITHVQPRLLETTEVVGTGANLYSCLLRDTSFDVESEAGVNTFHNRNSGNQVGNYWLTGSHGVFMGERIYSDGEDYQEECHEREYNEVSDEYEDCHACSWCDYEYNRQQTCISKVERNFYDNPELPLFNRAYWFNG